ncbi:uncharacterized protein TNIN_293341 [Trichonephila inaurata madagascariensis]|uniref:Uncharacterized protein n=1 Tax=Trichonephila inaurata madagascariensis TaxID=2747483 RepID=A0A8X6XEA4_9ARAC|nr:uncharacterized protein TNIN_293341 [Trichonephila inaurata madagascariensis]
MGALNPKTARLISSFPITSENYSKAVQQLKIRFGREDLLVQIYIRDLPLVMKNATAGRNPDLASLYDMLETKLRSLESLVLTKEKNLRIFWSLLSNHVYLKVFYVPGKGAEFRKITMTLQVHLLKN